MSPMYSGTAVLHGGSSRRFLKDIFPLVHRCAFDFLYCNIWLTEIVQRNIPVRCQSLPTNQQYQRHDRRKGDHILRYDLPARPGRRRRSQPRPERFAGFFQKPQIKAVLLEHKDQRKEKNKENRLESLHQDKGKTCPMVGRNTKLALVEEKGPSRHGSNHEEDQNPFPPGEPGRFFHTALYETASRVRR